MNKLKQIIAILVIGTLLFTACDNRDEVEGTDAPLPPCGFTFTSAELDNGAANIDVLDYDIDFVIAMSGECSTDYEMKYEVIDYTGSVEYKHDGEVKIDGDFFTIANGNFTDHIEVTGYDAAFSIKFTVKNTGSQAAAQTKTIDFSFAEFSITTPENKSVFAKQTATYTSTLSGGGPGTEYTVKVEKIAGGDDLGETLMINGVSSDPAFGDDITMNITGTELIVKLTPTNVQSGDFTAGSGNTDTPIAANYKVTVTKNNVEEVTENFNLVSKRPGFDITLVTNPTSVIGDNEFDLTVSVNLLGGYDQNLIYDFTISGYFEVKNSEGNFENADFERNGIDSSTSTDAPIPTPQIFRMKSRSTSAGGKTIYVTVKNQYGYQIENQEINIMVTN